MGFLLPICSWSQGVFVLGGRLDYESSQLVGRDYNEFYKSYNDYYNLSLTEAFDTINPGDFSHLGFGGSIRFFGPGKLAFQNGLLLTYGRSNVLRTSVFSNGIKSETNWEIGDLNLQYDVGVLIGQSLSLAVHMAGRFRSTDMAFGYYYQDGSYSIGNEYDILGVYSGQTITLDWGFNAGLLVKRFYFQIGMSFPTNAFSDDGLLTLFDQDERQIRWLDLPRDYQQWVDDPANMDPSTGFVRMSSLRSTRLNVGLEFFILK